MTVLARLEASRTDGCGYTTYVFRCLEREIIKQTKYVMCTRWPNWEGPKIEIGEVGYLQFMEIRAGKDEWFDGVNMIPYRHNNIQFIKFIRKPKKKHNQFIV
jgi:hypothetical protein